MNLCADEVNEKEWPDLWEGQEVYNMRVFADEVNEFIERERGNA